jgi:hypothetical protein
MKSKIFSLDLTDAQKAIIIAALSIGLTSVGKVIEVSATSGRLPTMAELIVAVKVGIGASAAYLLKNFITNSDDKIGKKESK